MKLHVVRNRTISRPAKRPSPPQRLPAQLTHNIVGYDVQGKKKGMLAKARAAAEAEEVAVEEEGPAEGDQVEEPEAAPDQAKPAEEAAQDAPAEAPATEEVEVAVTAPTASAQEAQVSEEKAQVPAAQEAAPRPGGTTSSRQRQVPGTCPCEPCIILPSCYSQRRLSRALPAVGASARQAQNGRPAQCGARTGCVSVGPLPAHRRAAVPVVLRWRGARRRGRRPQPRGAAHPRALPACSPTLRPPSPAFGVDRSCQTRGASQSGAFGG